MSNLMEYNCEKISGSISKIRVGIVGDTAAVKVIYKDSPEEYEYTGIGIDKVVDLERRFRKLTAKSAAGGHTGDYLTRWSIGKYVNTHIRSKT